MPYPGQPKQTPIPPQLNRWNWGAFLLNWIWGLGNGTYIALLMFVPLVNIVMLFVLGAKGSEWAWKNQQWSSDEQFLKTQRHWAIAGFIVVSCLLLVVGLVVLLFVTVTSLMRNNDAYMMSMNMVRTDERVTALFGQPIDDDGFVSGNVSIKGSKGEADFSIPVTGPGCEGKVISRATREAGTWTIRLLFVQPECQKAPIVLVNKDSTAIPNQGTDI